MPRIISFSIVKGGSAKTTTAVNVATCLSMGRKKVLLVDTDPQAHATICIGESPKLQHTIFEVMCSECTPETAIIHTKHGPNLLPSKMRLSDMEQIIHKNPDYFKHPAFILKNSIKNLNYDYIIIDTPPSAGYLTVNALSASTDVVIPLQCEYLATRGLNDLMDVFNIIRNNFNPSLNLLGIVGTMQNAGTNLASVIMQETRKHFAESGVKVFDTVIPRAIKIAESAMYGVPAVLYTDKAETYKTLTKEMFGV